MATLARAPVFSLGQSRRRHLPTPTQSPNLAVTTLALALALPLFADLRSNAGAPLHPARHAHLNADTSTRSPIALLSGVEASPPFKPLLSLSAPQRRHLGFDTSLETPKPLYVDAIVATACEATFPVPQRRNSRGNPADTTTDTPLTLLSGGPVQAPLVGLLPNAPIERARIGADTSRGTPKVLYVDAVVPAFNPPYTSPDRARRLPADTSARTPLGILASIVPAPVVPPPHLGPLRVKWLPAETSGETPKTLYGDALAPFANPQVFAPDRERPVVDTSRGLSALQLALLSQVPFVNLQVFAPDRERPVVDTSRGLDSQQLTLLSQAPIPPSPHLAPAWRKWLPSDTSAGMPEGVRFTFTFTPLFNPPHLEPQRPRRLHIDTAAGTIPWVLATAVPEFTREGTTRVGRTSVQDVTERIGTTPLKRTTRRIG